jgi:hypothetical protein
MAYATWRLHILLDSCIETEPYVADISTSRRRRRAVFQSGTIIDLAAISPTAATGRPGDLQCIAVISPDLASMVVLLSHCRSCDSGNGGP